MLNVIDTRLKLLIAIPFLLVALSFVISDVVPLPSALTPEEHQIIGFVPEDLSIPAVRRSVSGIDRSRVLTDVLISDRREQQGQKDTPGGEPFHGKVSMIVIGEKGKMAVVEGSLVREGDRIGEWIVRRIEPKRVLIEPASQQDGHAEERVHQWLDLEEVP